MDEDLKRVIFTFASVAVLISVIYLLAHLSTWTGNRSRKKQIKKLFPLDAELSQEQRAFLLSDLAHTIVFLKSEFDDEPQKAERVADHLQLLLTKLQDEKLSESDINQLNSIYKHRL
ncbi:hypothetical protein [Paenibacillus hunanensis]|uniref:Uncharacterized protein n=1 Tax=Paenibacillus hunanensis TaxID=539262 RepID=A0ABU1IW30_9BACL|nr:hypothetical protein [Paenibacillus hunanensis]MDR6243467.1 hypothetical protein [Paenibacillus hunanensis]GGI97980.1 hypothetical protein GCM10008022_03300 [Paenibacillus hunanensis]